MRHPSSPGLLRAARSARRAVLACLAAIAVVIALAAPASARTGPHWTVRDLGILKGGLTSTASAVNDRGEIVGWSLVTAPGPVATGPSCCRTGGSAR